MDKNIVSKVWVLLSVNYIFCDVFSLYHSVFLNKLISGKVDGIVFTELFLLNFSILMEVPMLMILITMLLKPKLNSIINILISVLMILVQVGSLVTGTNTKHYLFFSTVEICLLILIIYLAVKKNHTIVYH